MLARCIRAAGQISRPGSQTRILGFINGRDTLFTHNYANVVAVSPVDKGLDHTAITTVKLDKMFWSKPCSLALAKDSPLSIEEPNYEGIWRFLLKLMLYYSKQSTCIRGANVIFKRIITQVDKPAIYNVFNLEKTFKTTFSLLVLHMWLCLRRLKQEGKEGVEFGQYLYEIYNHDLELRVSKAGVNLLLTKWMKDLEKIFYGNLVAYDEALLSEAGKNGLANVIWRNVFSDDAGSEPSDDAVRVVLVCHIDIQSTMGCVQMLCFQNFVAMGRYVRREVTCLSLTDKEAMFSGNFMFTSLDNAQP